MSLDLEDAPLAAGGFTGNAPHDTINVVLDGGYVLPKVDGARDIEVVKALASVATNRRKDILRRFERIPQTGESIAQITDSTAAFRSMAEFILAEAPAGREQSLALTALEEAKFWTNQAIALNAEQTA